MKKIGLWIWHGENVGARFAQAAVIVGTWIGANGVPDSGPKWGLFIAAIFGADFAAPNRATPIPK